MILASFEPGKEMAMANFFLALFCLFSIALPLLLITRGDKTEANRDYIAATFNPWSKFVREPELTQVILSEDILSEEMRPKLGVASEHSVDNNPEALEDISLEIIKSNESNESLEQITPTNDELLAA
tara:strand:+ start:95 stop:475 length:381 start_codon:yes stop_codon:yes gene_type:complete